MKMIKIVKYCPCGSAAKNYIDDDGGIITQSDKCTFNADRMDWNTRTSPWVKTSERPPEENSDVLFIVNKDWLNPNDYPCFLGIFKFDKFKSDRYGWACLDAVDYWMPAPKLPEIT
jgi:hypothetical protein